MCTHVVKGKGPATVMLASLHAHYRCLQCGESKNADLMCVFLFYGAHFPHFGVTDSTAMCTHVVGGKDPMTVMLL